jgi:hypothetical protein
MITFAKAMTDPGIEPGTFSVEFFQLGSTM